jgi:hypothetical protein
MHNNSNPSKKFSFNLQIKKHWLWLLILSICYNVDTSAQIAIDDIDLDGFVHTELFNTLSGSGTNNTWTNKETLTEWYAASSSGGNEQYFTTYRATITGTNANLYSFGSDASDRALGSITTDLLDDIVFGIHFQNTSGVDINSIKLSFRAEHWWRCGEKFLGHQRIKVSYAIDNDIDLTPEGLFNDNNFIDVPEAHLISIDTSRYDMVLNGNAQSATIMVTIPLFIPDGSEFFLRFYDENMVGVDVGLAVDDLSITFLNQTEPRIQVTSDYLVPSYIDMGIVADIPDPDNSPIYLIPDAGDNTAWQQVLQHFYANNLDAIDASAYGYVVTEFTDPVGRPYTVLRKQNHSPYYWGTYINVIGASNKIFIQAPHAADDLMTGTQAGVVMFGTEAKGLMISGISRCSADENLTACFGETSVCSDNDTDELFRKSDVAHDVESIFHMATTLLADQNQSMVFVQLHGFEQEDGDPDLIISSGTINGQLKSVPDYPVMLRENLQNANSNLTFEISHLNFFTKLGAQTNVQGRYLNVYQDDICDDGDEPTSVTNRFLHIEQSFHYRKYPGNYNQVSTALNQTIDNNGYIRHISIYDPAPELNVYQENFINLHAPGLIHTWGNNLHVLGWYAVHEDIEDPNEIVYPVNIQDGLFSTYGLNNSPSPGGLYVFGDINDSALGSFSTTAATKNIAYGALFKNESYTTLYQMTLSYNSEQWRAVPNQTQRVQFGYAIGNNLDVSPAGILYGGFTNELQGDMVAQDGLTMGLSQWRNGNDFSTHIEFTVPIILNHNEEIFIRFFDADVISQSDEVMALDDFSISFSADSPPMPVDWLYFNITKKNGRPLLQWGADKEEECKTYEVLRSDNGKDFESMATLPCKGLALKNQYEYTDYSSLWQRTVYYKIAQYDENGEVTYSPVKSFNPTVASKPNVYYKNGELIVDADKEAKLQSVAVMDFMGRTVCKDTPTIENNSHYTMACHLPANQLLIVQLVFDSNTYVTHMRTGN